MAQASALKALPLVKNRKDRDYFPTVTAGEGLLYQSTATSSTYKRFFLTSVPSFHTTSLIVPVAPFTKPISTQIFCRSITLVP
jgi:hypothetical protein